MVGHCCIAVLPIYRYVAVLLATLGRQIRTVYLPIRWPNATHDYVDAFRAVIRSYLGLVVYLRVVSYIRTCTIYIDHLCLMSTDIKFIFI